MFGVDLPLVKTMIVVTFLVGLLPVLGNLISNTVIFLVSLSVSFYVALASLAFLIAIHKLEYFVNARIIGKMWWSPAYHYDLQAVANVSPFGFNIAQAFVRDPNIAEFVIDPAKSVTAIDASRHAASAGRSY